MAELKTFDFTGALGRGLQLGQAMRQQENQGKLAALLGQARTTSGPQRDALMGRAYGVDPGVGMAADQGFGKLDEAKIQRLGMLSGVFVNMTPEQRAQAWPSVKQELSQIIPTAQYPDWWDESLLPQAQSLHQQLGSLSGGAGGVPAGIKEFDYLTRAGELSPEDRAKAARVNLGLDGRASSAGFQSVKFTDSQGRDRIGVLNPRSGQIDLPDGTSFNPANGVIAPTQQMGGSASYGASAQAPQQYGSGEELFAGLDTIAQVTSGFRTPKDNERVGGVANSRHLDNMARDVLPPRTQEEAQQLRQFAEQRGLKIIDEGDHWHLQPQSRGGAPAADPFTSRRPEDDTAANEAAKRSVGLQFAPAEARAAAEEARLKREAERGVDLVFDKEEARPKARLAMQQARSRFERVDELIRDIEPNIGLWTAGFLGSRAVGIEGTPAHDLARNLDTLKAIAGFDELNAMRASSPTGGALGNVTERELAFLQSVVASIESSQSPEQLRRNIARFRREVKASWERVHEAYEEDFGGSQSGGKRLRFNPATGRIE